MAKQTVDLCWLIMIFSSKKTVWMGMFDLGFSRGRPMMGASSSLSLGKFLDKFCRVNSQEISA
jgi:hypothetical protein